MGDGAVSVVIQNNDDRVTKIECYVTCNINIDGCVLYPIKVCKFSLLYYEYMPCPVSV